MFEFAVIIALIFIFLEYVFFKIGCFWYLTTFIALTILYPPIVNSSNKMRGWSFWKTINDYMFKFRNYYHDLDEKKSILDKETEKSLFKNVIFAAFPHGLFSFATVFGISLYGCLDQDDENFPFYNDLKDIRIATNSFILNIPLFGLLFRKFGCVGADSKSILKTLTDITKSVIIVPEGLSGTLKTIDNGKEDFLLDEDYIRNGHQGFIDIAWINNHAIVPIYNKNETLLFKTVKEFGWLRNFTKKLIRYPFPIIFTPRRNIVLSSHFGKPIDPKNFETKSDFQKEFFDQFFKLKKYVDQKF
jgi:hypothetical protein